MKVLGISGSPRKGNSTDRLVKEVLSTVGVETEFVSLAGKKIAPCVDCLGCAGDNVCKVNDDMGKLRSKIVEADAYVIGGSNHFAMLNSLTHSFLERFFQFRHLGGKAVAGKPGVAVAVGGYNGDPVIENIKTFFQYNQIENIGSVSAQGVSCCLSCGNGEICNIGYVAKFYGPGTKITQEMIPDLDKQQDKLKEARELGLKLGQRLKTMC